MEPELSPMLAGAAACAVGSSKNSSNSGGKKNKSPVLTIKRAGRQNGQWQDFIDREHSTVDHLLQNSFGNFCQNIQDKPGQSGSTPKSQNSTYHHTIGGYRVRRKNSSSNSNSPESSPDKYNSGTLPRMPRNLFKNTEDSDGLHLPPGIEELENYYAPMKNLSMHLPNYSDPNQRMPPLPHPLMSNWNDIETFKNRRGNGGGALSKRDEDQESEICSVIIPPLLAPIQSHAILEKSLGHEIPPIQPRGTPATHKRSTLKFGGNNNGGPHSAPTLPTRTHSKLTMQQHTHIQSVNPTGIYANLNRSSLMSTGSSEESSGSSEVMSPPALSSTSEAVFSWPNYSVCNESPSPSPSSNVTDQEHRSVSQIGEPPDSSEASEASSSNTAYVKMNRKNPVSSSQSQCGSNSSDYVIYQDSASYVDMKIPNVKRLPNANVDVISSIYARPQSVTSTNVNNRKQKSSTSSSSSSTGSKSSIIKSKVSSEFKQLMQEVAKRRQFRVGLNLFNSRPETGIDYMASKGYIDLSPESVGKFLHKTDGLSMEKIGQYLGSLQSPFAMKVLSCFMQEFNFAGLRIDKSLRSLLQKVRVPGEAQKIERIMEIFGKRYGQCNPSFVSKLKAADSIVTLAFAIILLNTDLHTPNLKSEKKMQVGDFVNNLRGVDGGRDFDPKLLKQIYKGIKKSEFVTGVDHVVQVQALQASILNEQGKAPQPNLAQPHRRLVCLCRLFEVTNINSRKEPAAGSHQRDLFLFNDLLVVTKQTSKPSKNSGAIYTQRHSFPLGGLEVTLFHTPVFSHGIQISRKSDGAVLVTLNAGSEHDRYKFVMDLQESIFEMNQMEEAAQSLL